MACFIVSGWPDMNHVFSVYNLVGFSWVHTQITIFDSPK